MKHFLFAALLLSACGPDPRIELVRPGFDGELIQGEAIESQRSGVIRRALHSGQDGHLLEHEDVWEWAWTGDRARSGSMRGDQNNGGNTATLRQVAVARPPASVVGSLLVRQSTNGISNGSIGNRRVDQAVIGVDNVNMNQGGLGADTSFGDPTSNLPVKGSSVYHVRIVHRQDSVPDVFMSGLYSDRGPFLGGESIHWQRNFWEAGTSLWIGMDEQAATHWCTVPAASQLGVWVLLDVIFDPVAATATIWINGTETVCIFSPSVPFEYPQQQAISLLNTTGSTIPNTTGAVIIVATGLDTGYTKAMHDAAFASM